LISAHFGQRSPEQPILCVSSQGESIVNVPTIRLLTFTTLFPNAAQPNHGIFVENRLRHLVETQAVHSTVLAPVPFFPFQAACFGGWSRYARVPPVERRHGLTIYHPRYPVIPKIGMSAAPALLYHASLRALRRLIDSGLDFDAIDAHYLFPDGVAAIWLGQRLGRPVVVTARGSDVTELPQYPVPRRLIRHAIARADGLITVSAALKAGLLELGAPPERVRVFRNGVDTAAFRPADRAAARVSLGLSRPTLLSVGHLIERKGHHRVIEALAGLPGVDLLVIGEGPDRQKLCALAARFGVADRVRLLGAQPHAELPRFYTAADLLVLASSREGWANVLLEAMACGTPVVASNIPGNPEVVQSRAAGLIAENTPEAIAVGVRELLNNPPDRAETRAYAERFGWEETSLGQLELFNTVVGNCRVNRGDRPKGGGSGGWARRSSCPALSDSMVPLEGAVRDSGSNL
jgi:teichuronic acid biosynthesis glycosyltransferase TuaC